MQKEPTPAEKDVLRLLTAEFLTPKQVSRRRKTKHGVTKKHIANLKKKGLLGMVASSMVANTYTTPTTGHQIRLHAERYRIKLIEPSREFHRARERANSILVGGNRVVLYRDSLMVYSDQSFFGDDCDSCEAKACAYWPRFFVKLQSQLKILILKERSQNIKQTFYHFAELGNELADDLRRKKNKVRVFGSEDGKEWLLFDDSHKLSEAETTRPPTAKRTAKDDMGKVVQPFFNDLRDNEADVSLPSETAVMLNQAAHITLRQAQLSEDYAKNIEVHVKAIKALSAAGVSMASEVNKLRTMRKQSKLSRWFDG
ncbi:MarR family transcriptional regulator [Candidatus Woesearchaeota archaeon]|nr:MarR family transcriptional regulator [Candidatus Woesearchaeota archaeon]